MDSNDDNRRPPGTGATIEGVYRLPELSTTERDFWRRAVAEERARQFLVAEERDFRHRLDVN
jgi:hypothetical protein